MQMRKVNLEKDYCKGENEKLAVVVRRRWRDVINYGAYKQTTMTMTKARTSPNKMFNY